MVYTSGRRYARKYVKEYLQKTLSSRPNSGIIVGNITLQRGCFAKMEHKSIYQCYVHLSQGGSSRGFGHHRGLFHDHPHYHRHARRFSHLTAWLSSVSCLLPMYELAKRAVDFKTRQCLAANSRILG